MNPLRYLTLLVLPLLAMACSHPEYDISEGFNKEITLFQDEISVPVGSIGPFTIDLAFQYLGKVEGIGEVVAEFLKTDEDGNLYIDDTGSIFNMNVYEIEKEMDDPSEAQTWTSYYNSAYIGGLTPLLNYLGLIAVNQKVVISASNPLRVDVPVSSGSATYTYQSGEDSVTESIEELNSFSLPKRSSLELVSIDFPKSITSAISDITIEELSLDLPANPSNRLTDSEGDVFFHIDYSYSSGIGVGEAFTLPLEDLSPGDFKLEIGKYRLKKCDISLEIENTLPLSAHIGNVRVLKHKEPVEESESGEEEAAEEEENPVDENIVVQADFTIDGGTPAHPAVSQLTLSIEALEGTIPDLEGVLLDLTLNGQPGLEPVALTTSQGLLVKSSTAKLTGGITIPQE